MRQWFRDVWRGWSDADFARAAAKYRESGPGTIVVMSRRELQALSDYLGHGGRIVDL